MQGSVSNVLGAFLWRSHNGLLKSMSVQRMMRRAPKLPWENCLFHVCDAPTLLQLDGACRSLQDFVTIGDSARRLPMAWDVNEDKGNYEGKSLTATTKA